MRRTDVENIDPTPPEHVVQRSACSVLEEVVQNISPLSPDVMDELQSNVDGLGEELDLASLVEKLTEQQVAEFKECFEMFDEDGSGSIDKEELHFVLHMLGSKMTQKEIGDMMEEVDEDSSGDVEFAEFCALMARQMYATGEEHQLRQVFNILDESGSGLVSKASLRYVILSLNLTQTAEEVDDMFSVFRGPQLNFQQLYTLFQDQKPNIAENYDIMARQQTKREIRKSHLGSLQEMSLLNVAVGAGLDTGSAEFISVNPNEIMSLDGTTDDGPPSSLALASLSSPQVSTRQKGFTEFTKLKEVLMKKEVEEVSVEPQKKEYIREW